MLSVRATAAALAASLLLAGCPSKDSGDSAPVGLPTVVVLTVDALSPRILWGNDGQWETAPRLWEFMDQATVLPNVLTPRGLTAVSLSSFSTGTYPRDHGIRINSGASRPARTTLFERFQRAGYATWGYSANLCYVMDQGVDERVCTWSGEEPDLGSLALRDELLVEQLIERIGDHPAGEPLFLWLHLNQPHKPFQMVEEYYELFHPDPYEGDLDPSDVDQTYAVALGTMPFDEADRRHMEAVYASQVRATDDRLGSVLDALEQAGLYDDALVIFGADHSEELAEHHDFFYHGCPPYNDTLGITWAFRAPQLGAGESIDTWASMVDLAPTIVELAGIGPWTGQQPGRSLVSGLQAGVLSAEPVFLERGMETAGVIRGSDKYIMSGTGGTGDCIPYSDAGMEYPGELEELYDLDDDPDEHDNRVEELNELRGQLRSEVCDWVQQSDWVAWEEAEDNQLLQQCEDWSSGTAL